MKPARLEAIRRVERRQRPSAPAVVATVPSSPAAPARPVASARVRQMRELGLSVSADATPEQLDKLQERFDLICQYVRDVWRVLAGSEPAGPRVAEAEFHRFVAHLMDDGRLADALLAAQKTRRQQGGPIARNGDYRLVSRALRQFFPDQIPRASLFGRLLGRG
jgi:hypothetical protein